MSCKYLEEILSQNNIIKEFLKRDELISEIHIPTTILLGVKINVL